MSRQSLIENYFSCKASTSKNFQDFDKKMDNQKAKKRKLSLIKPVTPSKSPKVGDENKRVVDVINLCSDDDDISASTQSRLSSVNLSQGSTGSEGASSDSSQRTILYDLTPGSPKMALENLQTPQKLTQVMRTPQKTPKLSCNTPHSSQFAKFRSPSSGQKFFSPTKNRAVVKRSPGKVKRSLSLEMADLAELAENETFAYACESMDDKTKFLLTIINEFLKEPSLCDLLDPEGQGLLKNCLRVVKPGMRIVCRLYWRKEGWYKLDQIKDICDGKEPDETESKYQAVVLDKVITSLMENGLLVAGDTSNMCFEDFTSILGKDELKQISKDLKLKHADKKQDAIAALAKFCKQTCNINNYLPGRTSNNSERVLKMMNDKTPPRYKLSDLARATLYKLYLIMYLGTNFTLLREKKLEFMLLCEKTMRETYPVAKDMAIDNASVVFRNRHDFERYLSAHLIHEDFLTRTEIQERCEIVRNVYCLYESMDEDDMERYKTIPLWLRKYTPPYVYIKVLEPGIQDLKKTKCDTNYQLALEILSTLIAQKEFRQHKKAHWYDEKALILSNMCLVDAAAEVLIAGFKTDLSEEAKDVLRPRARKLSHQKNITLSEHLKNELLEYASKKSILEKNLDATHIYKQPMDRINKRGKVKFETRTAEGRAVQEAEEYCIAHYVNSGEYTHGEHWEGRIITTIFFLLFWDIIYSKPSNARGVFLSYYQVYPLDMFTESFYQNRKDRIQVWLEFIENSSMEELLSVMQATWEERPKCELSGIHWSIEWESLSSVASCLGPRAIAALCRRLATDYKYAHSGFPDLTLWHQHTKAIKFVEVKTDSDKPSIKQIQWMNYLKENGIATEWCYLGANTMRQRCRSGKKLVKTEGTPVKVEHTTPKKSLVSLRKLERVKIEPL